MAVRLVFKPPRRKRKLLGADATLADGDGDKVIDERLKGVFRVETEEEGWERFGARPKIQQLTLEDASAKSKRLQDEGNTLAEAGRFRSAMARWMEAADVDPSNAVLYELLAQACMAVYEDFRAIQFASKAVQLDPQWSDAYHTLGRCQLNYGELVLAMQNIDKAIELSSHADIEDMEADRLEIERLLEQQAHVLRQRDEQVARETNEGTIQALTCLKHLSLRGKSGAEQ